MQYVNNYVSIEIDGGTLLVRKYNGAVLLCYEPSNGGMVKFQGYNGIARGFYPSIGNAYADAQQTVKDLGLTFIGGIVYV